MHEMSVQELTAVIGVKPQQDERQLVPDRFECDEHVVLALAGYAHALGPTAGHVGGNQRVQVLTSIVDAAVGDQIDLQKANALLVPGCPRTDGHLRLEQRAGLGSAKAADKLEPVRAQAAV